MILKRCSNTKVLMTYFKRTKRNTKEHKRTQSDLMKPIKTYPIPTQYLPNTLKNNRKPIDKMTKSTGSPNQVQNINRYQQKSTEKYNRIQKTTNHKVEKRQRQGKFLGHRSTESQLNFRW